MATATWFPFDGVTVQRVIAVPKRGSSLKHWVKASKARIREMPELVLEGTEEQVVTENEIRLTWSNVGMLYIDRRTRKAL